jgi:hypothetical protein
VTAIQDALEGMPEQPEPEPKKPAPRRRCEDYETWVDEVWGAFVQAADSGLPFTTSEVQERHDLPDPPNPQAHWGKLPGRLKKAGLIEECDTGNSKRPTVHASLVHTWIGVPPSPRRGDAA